MLIVSRGTFSQREYKKSFLADREIVNQPPSLQISQFFDTRITTVTIMYTGKDIAINDSIIQISVLYHYFMENSLYLNLCSIDFVHNF